MNLHTKTRRIKTLPEDHAYWGIVLRISHSALQEANYVLWWKLGETTQTVRKTITLHIERFLRNEYAKP